MSDLPWPPGTSTGIGSLPGDDLGAALSRVLELCPELPFLPELPSRGPGAGMIGRGAALMAAMPVDLQPSGWRLVDRPGRDLHRARDLLARDLDALHEVAGDYAGTLKVQAAGPWTIAASLELNRGDKSLADGGARRDVGAALAQGLSEHVAEVGRRVPGACILLQLDEPSLPAVLTGHVPTASGFDVLRAVEEHEAEAVLTTVIRAAGVETLVHCCAPGAPVGMLQRAGARAVSLDMAMLSTRDDDALGVAIEAGLGLLAGVVPSIDAPLSDPASTVSGVQLLWRRLGFAGDDLAAAVVLTPSCGLAGASPGYAWAALARCREAAREMADA
ncbi:MAG: methionine synthase [Pseudonocardiales bacterium]